MHRHWLIVVVRSGARQWNNYEIETSLFIHELELEGNNAN